MSFCEIKQNPRHSRPIHMKLYFSKDDIILDTKKSKLLQKGLSLDEILILSIQATANAGLLPAARDCGIQFMSVPGVSRHFFKEIR